MLKEYLFLFLLVTVCKRVKIREHGLLLIRVPIQLF
jgi:hypothetical protein